MGFDILSRYRYISLSFVADVRIWVTEIHAVFSTFMKSNFLGLVYFLAAPILEAESCVFNYYT